MQSSLGIITPDNDTEEKIASALVQQLHPTHQKTEVWKMIIDTYVVEAFGATLSHQKIVQVQILLREVVGEAYKCRQEKKTYLATANGIGTKILEFAYIGNKKGKHVLDLLNANGIAAAVKEQCLLYNALGLTPVLSKK